MKNLKYLPALTVAAGLQFATITGFAQPDPNNAPKLENPQNRAPGGRANGRAQRLDPAAMEQRMEQRTKMQLQRLGITDTAQQDAIIAYADGEREAEMKLRQKGLEFQRSMRGNAATDAQLTALLNAYHVAIEENKERRTKALETLKQTADFTKNPRVEAYLTLAGLYGDGPSLLGGGGGMRGGQLGGGAMGGRGANRAGAGGAANGAGVNGLAPQRGRNRQRNNTPEAPAPAPQV